MKLCARMPDRTPLLQTLLNIKSLLNYPLHFIHFNFEHCLHFIVFDCVEPNKTKKKKMRMKRKENKSMSQLVDRVGYL